MTRDEKKTPTAMRAMMESPSPQPSYEMVGGKLVIRFPNAEPAPSVRIGGQTFRMDEGPSVIVGGKKMPVNELI